MPDASHSWDVALVCHLFCLQRSVCRGAAGAAQECSHELLWPPVDITHIGPGAEETSREMVQRQQPQTRVVVGVSLFGRFAKRFARLPLRFLCYRLRPQRLWRRSVGRDTRLVVEAQERLDS
eukprot:CAMPEP_0194540346 /NCGR_PEP_ID=MMETSP0253-20130528/80516_1 /TAXON_ID=2966 /ORGANISM="Noctiluca scintillans" /LENGTH=121 /DNA_ID=CAMNT_0039386709 /DNA_START=234 /DNA_END=599 /DNA_ORIENTATION=-